MSLPQPSNLRLAVLGGGISGLTAAYRLTKLLPAARIELFEASDRLGGVLETHQPPGLLVERGADSFQNKLCWGVELCEELGIAEELIHTNSENRRALILKGDQLHPVPEGFVIICPHSMSSIMKTPLLSWRGKLRVFAESSVPVHPEIDRPDFDESVASFAKRRLGAECFERLVQPLLAGIYTADPEKLSMAATMPNAIADERVHGSLYRGAKKRSGEASQTASGARYGTFQTLRGGLSRLVQELAEQIGVQNIRMNQGVNSLRRQTLDQWVLETDAEEVGPFDGVVVALPTPRAANILETTDEALAGELARIPYASSAIVSLAYRTNQISKLPTGFGIVVPSVENRPFIAASFSSVKFPGRAPDDQLLVRVFLGGATLPEQMKLSDLELESIALGEMKKHLGTEASPLWSDIVRWNEKMPQYHVGHLQLVERIERRVREISGLELAGNAYRGVGIPQCIHSGDEAAHRLAETIGVAKES